MKKKETGAIVNHTVFSEEIYVESMRNLLSNENKRFVFATVLNIVLFFIVSVCMLLQHDIMGFFIGCILMLWVLFKTAILIYRQQKVYYRRLYRKRHKGQQPERTYCFTKKTISSKRWDSEFTLRYEQIVKIYETEHTLVLCTDPSFFLYSHIFVDKNGFKKGTYEDFREQFKNECGAPWK